MTCPLCGSLSLAVPSRSGHPPGNVERRDSGQPSIHARLVAKLEAWMTDTHDPMLPDLFNRFRNDAFWRDPERIPAGLRVV
jgi:hypothetical protein